MAATRDPALLQAEARSRSGGAAVFPKQRLIELDGLRGFALILILVFHAVAQEGAYPPGTFLHYLQRSFAMGWTALVLFFVMSGFLFCCCFLVACLYGSLFMRFYVRR